ncbi:SDR family NAD(P)-dependent oxidoreductase [Paraburkholderia sp. NMBU_R16]|uniref:type I polyketide synthase n=1 Tax=Paraburkholderia sp. NMBU_R16 TaxID=2698676 RepID=UPI001564B8C4|nr:type I polyketide synthase [Paraburkholderia sp. NMBU_R16]NRO99001.1 SDR family NAD(P)-dependent oxidoreductase [Paraburkholderia sp. NMBU_R16]
MHVPHDRDAAIAICGIGCRFPGSASSKEGFWSMVIEGLIGTSDVPTDRWNVERFFDPTPGVPGKSVARVGGFLTQPLDAFDAKFFGIAPREAAFLDPQQRLLLEVAWEAIDDAGIVTRELRGSNTGVYVGGFMTDHLLTQLGALNRDAIGRYTEMGSTLGMLANRLSYTFDLRGPSITVDTACSSSLVAFHYACQALLNGECDVALAGGVNVMSRPETFVALSHGGFLAKDGHSKSFDERGDGYGRGEGAGIVVLKPLDVALSDGSQIYAVVRGTGVNQDGRTDGITVPNPDAQAALIEQVLARSGVTPHQISYVEAHGTGTAVGDPIEVNALGSAIGDKRASVDLCALGSVKANIGHLEAAAGIAGLIKSALCLSEGMVPPVAGLQTKNSKIPFSARGLRLPKAAERMSGVPGERCAAINSFGYGGTNAHAILQEPPLGDEDEEHPDEGYPGPRQLLCSAHTRAALSALAAQYRDQLKGADARTLHDICYSAALRRTHHDMRAVIDATSVDSVIERLDTLAAGEVPAGVTFGEAVIKESNPVFVFSGMGGQWFHMGRELYENESVFRNVVIDCDEAFKRIAGWSIAKAMFESDDPSQIHETQIAQPATFVIQTALAALWRSWGIEPAAVVGHSAGEVASAYVSGMLRLEDAIWIIYHRSRIQKKAAGQGKMLALGLSASQAVERLKHYDDSVCIAVVNSPRSVVLAGDESTLAQIAASAEREGVFNRFVEVEVASHSPSMDQLLPEIRESLDCVTPREAAVPIYSTVTGKLAVAGSFDAQYWCRNIREPVLFSDAISQIANEGHRLFVEVAPHPILSTALRECLLNARIEGGMVFPSLRRDKGELEVMRASFAEFFVSGGAIDGSRSPSWRGRFHRPPSYPWQRQRHWTEGDESSRDRLERCNHRLLGRRLESPVPTWESEVGGASLAYLHDHVVEGSAVLPGAAYVDLGFAAQREITGQACELRDIEFHQALHLPTNEWPRLRTTYDDVHDTFCVHSFDRAGRTWTLHAEGTLRNTVPRSPEQTAGMLLDLQERCPLPVPSESHYRSTKRRGVTYGPSFQPIASAWRSVDGSVVLAKLDTSCLCDEADDTSVLHPALLDGCFQTLLTLLDSQTRDDNVYVPVRVKSARFHRPADAHCWVATEIKDRTRSILEADILLLADSGETIAKFEAVRVRAISDRAKQRRSYLAGSMYEALWWETEPEAPCEAKGSWIVVGESSDKLASQLEKCCASCVSSLQHASTSDVIGSIQAANDITRLIWLAGSDASADTADPVGTKRVGQCLELIQALLAMSPERRPRLTIVTTHAQSPLADYHSSALPQAGINGLLRVLLAETPDVDARCIDIDSHSDTVAQLAGEIASETRESDVALRRRARFVRRIERMDVPAEDDKHTADSGRENTTAPFTGDSLEIEVNSLAVARDNATSIGFGTVIRTHGASVYRTGDCVSFKIKHTPSDTRIVIAARDALPVPTDAVERLSPLVTAFVATLAHAYHVCINVGNLRPGECVAVLDPGEFDAIAYSYIARLCEAKIAFVNAETTEHTVHGLPSIIGTFDRCAPDWQEALKSCNGGKPANLIVNLSPRTDADEMANVASECARVVALHNAEQRSRPYAFEANISLTLVDLAALSKNLPALLRNASRAVCAQMLAAGIPSFEQAYPLSLSVPDARNSIAASRAIRSTATYLITGGYGGFGFEIARWLASRGAAHIALVSRRETPPPEIATEIDALERSGVTLYTYAIDVANAESVRAVLDDLSLKAPALAGVFHTAAVLRDGPLDGISHDDLAAVMAPKALGAWNLHFLTQHMPLDHFVLFSSISALIGNPGQGAYVAANAVLDALAAYRRSRGLVGLSIGWGALSDVGLVARNAEISSYLTRIGIGQLTPDQALHALEILMQIDPAHAAVAPVDWRTFATYHPGWASSPVNSALMSDIELGCGSDGSGHAASQGDLATPESRLKTMRTLVSQVLQIQEDEIDDNLTLLDMGIDSLMAMDLQLRCEQRTGIRIPVLELLRADPLKRVAENIAALAGA